MALTREQKEARVAETSESLKDAVSLVFMSYDALGVTDMEELRGNLAEQGVRLRVIPKRLLKLVMANVGLDFDPTAHEGQLAVVWGDDALQPAKVLYEFAKTRENIQLLAGSMDGGLLSGEEVTALAQLPGREELLAKLVGSLAAPLTGLQGVLTGVPRAAVYVLTAIKEQKEAQN